VSGREAARAGAINRELASQAAMWQAVYLMMTEGADGAGRVRMRFDGTRRMLDAHLHHPVPIALADLPLVVISTTTPLEDIRRHWPGTVERAPALVAAPYARTELYLGGFAKGSMLQSPRKAAAIRAFVSVRFMDEAIGIVTHKGTCEPLIGMANTQVLHHGAAALVVPDGPRPSRETVRALVAARTGRAVSDGPPVYTSAPILMSDGTIRTVPRLEYEDPNVQAVYSGIHDSAVTQRGRDVCHPQRSCGWPDHCNAALAAASPPRAGWPESLARRAPSQISQAAADPARRRRWIAADRVLDQRLKRCRQVWLVSPRTLAPATSVGTKDSHRRTA
jgi:hypothetical protein